MAEINALPTATAIDDADFLVVHRAGREASQQTRKVSRVDFLDGVARETEDVGFGAVTAENIAAPTGSVDSLTVATSLTIGASLQKVLTATASTAIPTLAAGASSDVTLTVVGAVAGDVAIVNPQVVLPGGLRLRAYVSGADTVTISVLNGSTASITGASYSIKAVLLRVT